MKKIMFVLIAVFLIFCSLYGIDHIKMDNNEPVIFSTWGKKYAPPEEGITEETAIDYAKSTLDEKRISMITNYDNPGVELIKFDRRPSIYYMEKEFNVVGRDIYKITFNTTLDGLLGPEVFYIDRLTGKIIGMNFRE